MTDVVNEGVRTIDAVSHHLSYIAGYRNARPHGNHSTCPFCPRGAESLSLDKPYYFANRFPPIEQKRCEILVFGPDHNIDLGGLEITDVVCFLDLAKERTAQHFRMQGTQSVLLFENRGSEAGASVPHPHAQLFSFPFVPPSGHLQQDQKLACMSCRQSKEDFIVEVLSSWTLAVPEAPKTPFSIRLTPSQHIDRLDYLDQSSTRELATALSGAIRHLDAVFKKRMPYHLWCLQIEGVHLTININGLLRSADRLLTPGAAEAATGMSFNPVDPKEVAKMFRET